MIVLCLTTWTLTAGAAQQVFDVDAGQSVFTVGSIDVAFTAVVHSNGIFGSQSTVGGATTDNTSYAASGTVTLDVDTGQVTLDGLSIGGDVNASGAGELVWANLFTFNFIYTIMSQSLDLNSPLTMALSSGSFSGTPNFQFAGVSDGQVTGLVNYSIPSQTFASNGDMAVDGTLSAAGLRRRQRRAG
jgi:hypothetical protein